MRERSGARTDHHGNRTRSVNHGEARSAVILTSARMPHAATRMNIEFGKVTERLIAILRDPAPPALCV
jgi:hypothetical protein